MRVTAFGKLIRQEFLQLGTNALARRNVLCNNHCLGEEVIGKLDIQRQVEADGAAPDIGAPARNIRIAFKSGIKALCRRLAGIDRCVLRKTKIDEKFRAIG